VDDLFYPVWYFADKEHVEIVCTCGQRVHIPAACLRECDHVKTVCIHCGEVVEMQKE
jgi:hypothetical protein